MFFNSVNTNNNNNLMIKEAFYLTYRLENLKMLLPNVYRFYKASAHAYHALHATLYLVLNDGTYRELEIADKNTTVKIHNNSRPNSLLSRFKGKYHIKDNINIPYEEIFNILQNKFKDKR